MKKLMILACAVALGAFVLSAPANCGTCGTGAKKAAAACSKCGEAKGGGKCCKEGVEKCPKCGLNAGSPGCKAKCEAKAEAAK